MALDKTIDYVSAERKSELKDLADKADSDFLSVQHRLTKLAQRGNHIRSLLRGKPADGVHPAILRDWQAQMTRLEGVVPSKEELAEIDTQLERLEALAREKRQAFEIANYRFRCARVGEPPQPIACGMARGWTTHHEEPAPVKVVDGSTDRW